MGAQASAFQQCFCVRNAGDLDSITLCDSSWSFWNQDSCQTWLKWNLAWSLGLFIFSGLFLSLICACCCGKSKCRCVMCCVENQHEITRKRVTGAKIAVISVSLCALAVLATLLSTSIDWGAATTTLLETGKKTVFDLTDVNINISSSIVLAGNTKTAETPGTYLYEAVKTGSLVPSVIMSSEAVAVAKTALSLDTTARKAQDLVVEILHDIFSPASPFGRPRLTIYGVALCGVAVVAAVVFVLFANDDLSQPDRERRIGYAAGFLSFGVWMLLGISIGFSISSSFMFSDICSVWNGTIAPFMCGTAAEAQLCANPMYATAAVKGSALFAEFLTTSQKYMKDTNPCDDVTLLLEGMNATTQQKATVAGCSASHALPALPLGSSVMYDVSAWNRDVDVLTPESMPLAECASKCRSAAVRAASARLVTWQTEIGHPLQVIISTAHNNANCSQYKRDLRENVGPTLCDGTSSFLFASTVFSYVGAAWLLVSVLTLIALRYGMAFHLADPSTGTTYNRASSTFSSSMSHSANAFDVDDAHYYSQRAVVVSAAVRPSSSVAVPVTGSVVDDTQLQQASLAADYHKLA